MFRKFNFFILAALLIASSGATQANAWPKVVNGAWKVGERLDYAVKFGFFNAGATVFSVEETDAVAGRPAVRFRSLLTSSQSFFFKLRDEAVSISDAESLASFRYDKDELHGDEKEVENAVFNHEAKTSRRTENGRLLESLPMTAFSKDVLGAIYYVRTQKLEVGKMISFPVNDGRRQYTMEVRVPKKERIQVPLGTYECLRVEPRLRNVDGTYKKKGEMVLWMTDDARHLPVRVRMQLPIGSLVASLSQARNTL